ncbi:MAG: germination protein [Clostridiales bacterium]|jgi:germination protein M|nr:germination protein [Clostridiales bacterium]MDK2934162.1 germination protein [Clostridiales bacterium]
MKKIVIVFMITGMILLSACNLINTRSREVYNEENIADKIQQHITNKNIQNDKLKDLVENQSETKDIEKDKSSGKDVKRQENDLLSEMRYTTLYYQDKDGLLIPITRKTAKIEGIAKAAIASLIDVSIMREDIGRIGLFPVLPGGTSVRGMTIKNGVATIDFNDSLFDYDTAQNEKNILLSIVYTLTEFDTIDSVQIIRNGEQLDSLKFGSSVKNPLRRQSINYLSGDMKDMDINKEQIEVYFTKLVNNKYLYYVPVTKFINRPFNDLDKYTQTLKELIKGDEVGNKDLKSYIPKTSGLKGIKIEGQTVILDFNDEILKATGSDTSFNVMLNQILLCFKQFGKVKKIKINVDGKPLEFPAEYEGKEALDVPEYANLF